MKGGEKGKRQSMKRHAMTGGNMGRGFNLIDSAIVLGVVGIVIGGIWVAASAVREAMKVSETIQGVFLTSRNIQRVISTRDAEAIGQPVDITTSLIDAGVFPRNWIQDGRVIHPLGGETLVISRVFFVMPNWAPRFTIYLEDVAKKKCVDLVMRFSSIGASVNGSQRGVTGLDARKRAGLVAVFVNYIEVAVAFPIGFDDAVAACDQDYNVVDLTFSYTRTN